MKRTKVSLERLKKNSEWIYFFLGFFLVIAAIFKKDIDYAILGGISFLFVRLTEITRRQL